MKKADIGRLFDVADKIDLNHDGIIDLEDLNSSLNNTSNMTLDDPQPFPLKKLSN